MKINFVIPGVSLTGGIMVVFRYAEILQKRGHEVTLYVPLKALDVKNSRKEIVNKTHIITNTIKRIWLYGFKRIHNNVGYNVNIKTVSSINNRTISDADVVIATAWPTAFLVDKLNCEKGKKVYFIQGYEIWNNEEYGKKTYELGLNKIVISKWIDNKLKIQLGCQDNPIVYDGIDDIFLNKPYRGRKFDDNIKITMLLSNTFQKSPKKSVEKSPFNR